MKWMAAALALAAGAMLTPAHAGILKVGDKAPKIQVGKWVQGEPVKEFASDKAYIVEFWATWCPPCRASIPHLNEIYKKYRDQGLVVIGQDCAEREESKVEPFVKEMGEKMTYRVALDDKENSEDGKMNETWMEAAGQEGIPCAFVVDKHGMIAWIGHPMTLEERVLDEVLADKFDLKKATADYEPTAKKLEAKKKEREAIAKQREPLMKLSSKLNAAMRDKHWDEADSTINEIEKLLPEEARAGLAHVRFRVALGKGDGKAAGKFALQVSDANKDDAGMQNELAWTLLTNKDLKERDLAAAEKISIRANDAAQGKDPAIMDTLARAYFMQDKKDEAIQLQEKAVALAQESDKARFRKTLDSYKAGKLPEVGE
jgi:thiol-disulfide isomerase/thioredoxin